MLIQYECYPYKMTERREEGREREGERDQAERDTQRENVMIICKTNTFCQPRKKKAKKKRYSQHLDIGLQTFRL